MTTDRLSSISDNNDSDEGKRNLMYAKIIVAIGTCIIGILYSLSHFFYWEFLSKLLSLFTGTSIIFICYIIALILVLTIDVTMKEPKQESKEESKEDDSDGIEYDYWSNKKKQSKPSFNNLADRLAEIWMFVLIVLGIVAVYYSNLYRKNYAFECSTFLVDQNAGIYHLDCHNKCEDAAQAFELEKMKGFQIDDSYTFCEWCKEWAEDAEADFEYHRYFRK